MGFNVKVGIHETGEIFDSRKEAAQELGLTRGQLEYCLYDRIPWNGLNFYVISPDKNLCRHCGNYLREDSRPAAAKKGGWRICGDCYRKNGRKGTEKHRQKDPLAVKASAWKRRYNCNIPKSDLEGLWDKQGPYCNICNIKITKKDSHLDHIKPVSKGGKSEISNLQFLCEMCNRGKFNWSTQDYIEHCKRVVEANLLVGSA